MICKHVFYLITTFDVGRRRGLVVERRTSEREVEGSILTEVAVLYP